MLLSDELTFVEVDKTGVETLFGVTKGTVVLASKVAMVDVGLLLMLETVLDM